MRDLSPDLQNHLAGSATTLCWLWRITRADGTILGKMQKLIAFG